MPRRPTLRPLPLIALTLACGVALVVVYLVLLRTYHGQRLDQGAFEGRALATPRATAAAADLLTTISVGSLALATGVLVVQALVRGRVSLAVLAATIVGGALITTEVLKHTLSRPDLIGDAALLSGADWTNSFPSGHSTIAFGVGVAATLVAPPRLRRFVAVGAVLYGAAIGIAVIAAGWHRPSDVAGAFFVVAGWAALASLACAAIRPDAFAAPASTPAWPNPGHPRAYLVVGAVLLVGGYLAAIAVVAAGRLGTIDLTTFHGAFVGACAAVAALAALLMAALLGALRESLRPAR